MKSYLVQDAPMRFAQSNFEVCASRWYNQRMNWAATARTQMMIFLLFRFLVLCLMIKLVTFGSFLVKLAKVSSPRPSASIWTVLTSLNLIEFNCIGVIGIVFALILQRLIPLQLLRMACESVRAEERKELKELTRIIILQGLFLVSNQHRECWN